MKTWFKMHLRDIALVCAVLDLILSFATLIS